MRILVFLIAVAALGCGPMLDNERIKARQTLMCTSGNEAAGMRVLYVGGSSEGRAILRRQPWSETPPEARPILQEWIALCSPVQGKIETEFVLEATPEIPEERDTEGEITRIGVPAQAEERIGEYSLRLLYEFKFSVFEKLLVFMGALGLGFLFATSTGVYAVARAVRSRETQMLALLGRHREKR